MSALLFLTLPAAILLSVPAGPGGPDAVLDRMDQAAAAFHSMTAGVKHVSYTEVIHDTSEQRGTVKMRKLRPGEVEGLLDFTAPEQKVYLFQKRLARIYTPAGNTVEEIDLGRHGEQLDQFLMIGFGTSKADLLRNYTVKFGGHERLDGHAVSRIELTPKSGEAMKYFTLMELWISDETGYPVQEKLTQPSKDYVLVVYSGLTINPPLNNSDFDLHLPKGVETIRPQK
jgi:outer membrane lipoprotein-sorting protein